MECNGFEDIHSMEHEPDEWKKYWDDTSGEELDATLAMAARQEEAEDIHKMGVYEKVSIDQCLRESGKRPIGTRWVDVNKGDKQSPKVRSRLVAQEVNTHKQPELFAATPPLSTFVSLYPVQPHRNGQMGQQKR